MAVLQNSTRLYLKIRISVLVEQRCHVDSACSLESSRGSLNIKLGYGLGEAISIERLPFVHIRTEGRASL